MLVLWLGWQYLFQTFEDDTDVNVVESRQLLEDADDSDRLLFKR